VRRFSVGKAERKRPLEIPKRRWEYNMKIDLRKIRFQVVDWMNMAQDRDRWWALVNTVMNLLTP
jgi:hypothetical protein